MSVGGNGSSHLHPLITELLNIVVMPLDSWPCHMCSAEPLSSYRNFQFHSHMHNEFKCTFCSWATYTHGPFIYHILTHLYEMPYTCEICGTVTQTGKILFDHLIEHYHSALRKSGRRLQLLYRIQHEYIALLTSTPTYLHHIILDTLPQATQQSATAGEIDEIRDASHQQPPTSESVETSQIPAVTIPQDTRSHETSDVNATAEDIDEVRGASYQQPPSSESVEASQTAVIAVAQSTQSQMAPVASSSPINVLIRPQSLELEEPSRTVDVIISEEIVGEVVSDVSTAPMETHQFGTSSLQQQQSQPGNITRSHEASDVNATAEEIDEMRGASHQQSPTSESVETSQTAVITIPQSTQTQTGPVTSSSSLNVLIRQQPLESEEPSRTANVTIPEETVGEVVPDVSTGAMETHQFGPSSLQQQQSQPGNVTNPQEPLSQVDSGSTTERVDYSSSSNIQHQDPHTCYDIVDDSPENDLHHLLREIDYWRETGQFPTPDEEITWEMLEDEAFWNPDRTQN